MSTLAEVLCGRVHPRWMSTFEAPCLSCDHLAAVAAEWLGSDEVREVVADWLPDRNWCESNYTRGCNCKDDRNIHARAVLAALAAHAKGEAT